MNKISQYIIAITLVFAITLPAYAAQLNGTLTVEDGSFFCMGAPYPAGTCAPLKAGSDGGILLGSHQPFVLDPDVPNPPRGTGYTGTPTVESNMLLPFNFFGSATYIGTNPISYQSGDSHPAPLAEVDAIGNLTVELSAWEVMWNGSAFEQGPRPSNSGPFTLASGTYDSATGAYFAEWPSQIKGGPFGGVPAYWLLIGYFEPEPLVAFALAEPRTLNVKSKGNGFSVRIELEDTDGTLVPATNIAESVIITTIGTVDIPDGAVTENTADRIIEDMADPANSTTMPNGIDELQVFFNDPATGSRQDINAALANAEDGSQAAICVTGSATDTSGTLRPFEACSNITVKNKGVR